MSDRGAMMEEKRAKRRIREKNGQLGVREE